MTLAQRLKNLKHLATAKWYAWKYKNPARQLKLIGVTGTDGKTTTSTMIYSVLHQAGFKVALVSTISAKIGDKDYDTGFHVTSPTPDLLHKFLRQMVDEGIEYAVLETTSHGLHQHRFAGLSFDFAVYTNITHEHLDYHRSYEEYVAAKALLLSMLKPDGKIIVNKDDRSFGYLQSYIHATEHRFWTYGQEEETDTRISKLALQEKGGSIFDIQMGSETATTITLQLPGDYNAYNAAAAFTVARLLHIPGNTIAHALGSIENLTGRWEVMRAEPFKVVVDFAHTPNALERVLQVAKSQVKKPHRVIEVFGCAGRRDYTKRPLMGAVAGKYADLIIVTSEDPRDEKIDKINVQIEEGLKQKRRKRDTDYFLIPDRRAAIAKALSLAQPGDIVLITGKGHEQSMNLDGKTETPWSDQVAVKELLTTHT